MRTYKNRFERDKKISGARLLYLLPLLAFLVLFILFYRGINSVSETTIDKQKESLETALTRSITQCYAVEGVYPPDLTYIEEHYGLTYDKTLFLVDYRPIGSNIMPDVTVLTRTGGIE